MSKNEPKQPTCPVCMDHFTAVIRQPITCPYCPSASCRQCTSHYLLTSLNDPHCLGCKREWNREFIDTKLTQTFRKGALRLHRRKVLIDRERGRLPAMQVFLEAQIDYDAASKIYAECRAKRVELKRRRNLIQAQYAATDTMEQLLERLRPLSTERRDLKEKMAIAEVKMRNAYAVLHGKEKEVRQFIMKCPADGEEPLRGQGAAIEPCRGFLSSAWKCGTCQKFFCADCHAVKSGQKDDDHVCNPDAKATAAMIKQETKPCPKCGIRISKIDGCDQMWCTSCQTTFSWNSGQILLNTVVHNPHYYEYLRRANNGTIPREAGDVPCGGLPNAYLFTRLVMEIAQLNHAEKTELLDIVRCLSDIQYVRLPQFPLRQAANSNQKVDIQYLRRDVTEEEWGTSLERMETTGDRKKEIGLILQTLLHVGSEKLTQLQNSTRGPERAPIAISALEELKKVRDYTNKSLKEKGKQMGMVVPQITKQWHWSWLRRAEMKTGDKLEGEADPAADSPDADADAPPPPPIPDACPPSPGLLHPPEEDIDTVMVDMDGEMVEMARHQALALLT